MSNNQKESWLEQAMSEIESKMGRVSINSKNKIPYTTIGGIHDDRSSFLPGDDGINWWTNGFWGGIQWLLYQSTGNDFHAEVARGVEEKLDKCFEMYEDLHHDVGFMWLLTAVADYRLTGWEVSKKRGLHAANLLAGRFNPAGSFIRAWNGIPDGVYDNRGWAIIDSLMNMPILYWAAEETKDPRYSQIARLHADTVLRHFVREDGSVRHIVEFDPVSGVMRQDHGGQGYAQGSSWTRGQAWGIYGFTLNYLHSGISDYLEAAERIAEYFLQNIPESGMIPVDFRQPQEPMWEDSTAAAIAACGLLELAELTTGERAEYYKKEAVRLVYTLYKERCDFGNTCDCMVQNGSVAYHAQQHHQSIIYGDYFFMEAIYKMHNKGILLW